MKWWKFRRLVFYLVDRALQGCFKPHAVVPNWKIVILCPGLRKEYKTALCDFINK